MVNTTEFPKIERYTPLDLFYKPTKAETAYVRQALLGMSGSEAPCIVYHYLSPKGACVRLTANRGSVSLRGDVYPTVYWQVKTYQRLNKEFDFWRVVTFNPGNRKRPASFVFASLVDNNLFGCVSPDSEYSLLSYIKQHWGLLCEQPRTDLWDIHQAVRSRASGMFLPGNVFVYHTMRAYAPEKKWDIYTYRRLVEYTLGKHMVPHTKELISLEGWERACEISGRRMSKHLAEVWCKLGKCDDKLRLFRCVSGLLVRLKYAPLRSYLVRKYNPESDMEWKDLVSLLLEVYKKPKIKSRGKLLSLLRSRDNRPKWVHDTLVLWINEYHTKRKLSQKKNAKPYNLAPEVLGLMQKAEQDILSCPYVTKVQWPENNYQVMEWGLQQQHCIGTYAKEHGKSVLLAEVEVAGQRTHLGLDIHLRGALSQSLGALSIAQWYGYKNSEFFELSEAAGALSSKLCTLTPFRYPDLF